MNNPFADVANKQAEVEAIKVPTALPKVAGRRVHVDGDYLCYFASGNDETDPGVARMNAMNYIQKCKDSTGAEKAVLHLTAKGCHKGERYLIATVKPYQGQRDKDYKPKNWQYLREWGEGYSGDEFLSKVWSSREADDGIATCAHYAAEKGGLDGIATADKDMRMLPGLHLDWKDHTILTTVRQGDFRVMGENGKIYGLLWFWLQMLQGDGADYIPGLEYAFLSTVPGKPERMVKVGPKTAEKILQGCTSHAEAYTATMEAYRRGYNGTGDWADRFVEQAALLWMRLGPKAEVLDFMDHLPFYNQDIAHAADALDKRVKAAREKLNGLSD